jgi:hypothetical protein
MQLVAGIQETKIVSCSQSDSFVHGIIKPFVRLAHYLADAVLVLVGDVQCVVFGLSIYDDIFYVLVRLAYYALYGILQYVTGIVSDGDDGKFRV